MAKSSGSKKVLPAANSQHRMLLQVAAERAKRGFAPPAEIYRLRGRADVDWSLFPSWAQPVDPDVFDGCCHEG